MKVEKFIIGKDDFPTWFNDEAAKGRARVNKDDDGNIINVIVYNPTTKLIANIGDTIMLSKSGLLVIPQEKAKEYHVQPSGSKKEKNGVNKDEEGTNFKETT